MTSTYAHVGASDVACGDGLRFDDATLTLEAAANGLGLALARRSLVDHDLSSSRLVRVLPHEAPTVFSYHLLALPEKKDNPNVALFCQWLLAEAGGGAPANKDDDPTPTPKAAPEVPPKRAQARTAARR